MHTSNRPKLKSVFIEILLLILIAFVTVPISLRYLNDRTSNKPIELTYPGIIIKNSLDVVSPYFGILTSVEVQPGSHVDVGDQIFEIQLPKIDKNTNPGPVIDTLYIQTKGSSVKFMSPKAGTVYQIRFFPGSTIRPNELVLSIYPDEGTKIMFNIDGQLPNLDFDKTIVRHQNDKDTSFSVTPINILPVDKNYSSGSSKIFAFNNVKDAGVFYNGEKVNILGTSKKNN